MKNGLYSIHVTLQDGRVGKGSGVIMFRDGHILGGDAYLFYTGTYTVKDNTFKGEVLVQRHTSSPDANPLFGGPTPVGIGVTGTFTDTRAVMSGTALVGKASQIFGATLRKLSRHRLERVLPNGSAVVGFGYSAACSSGATRGRMIWIRVPPPGSESRSSRPPRRLVTML